MATSGPAKRPDAWPPPCLRRVAAGATLGTVTGAAFGVFDGFRAAGLSADMAGFARVSSSAATRAVVGTAAAGCTVGFCGFMGVFHGTKCVMERTAASDAGGWPVLSGLLCVFFPMPWLVIVLFVCYIRLTVVENPTPCDRNYGPWGNTAVATVIGLAPFLRLQAVRRNMIAVALVVGVDLYHELEHDAKVDREMGR